MKTYSTPQPRTVAPPPRPEKTKDQLEDEYSYYRKDCAAGLCQSDPKIHAEFKAKIALLA